MINRIKIDNYKCLKDEALDLKNLSILTGVNSCGKSSVIQSLLLMAHFFGEKEFLNERYKNYNSIRNKYEKAELVSVCVDDRACIKIGLDNKNQKDGFHDAITFEKNIFRLSEDRIGAEEIARFDSEKLVGENGEFLLSLYEKHKAQLIEFNKDDDNKLFYQNVDHWLNYILDQKIELITEKITSDQIKVMYNINKLPKISPFHLGAGVNYLTKIIILCLYAKKNDTVIIENPEIHLHPKAQSRLSEFFTFIASKGLQLILETHCDHIINRLRYEVYKKNIADKDVVIYYKDSIEKPFQKMAIEVILLMMTINGYYFPPVFLILHSKNYWRLADSMGKYKIVLSDTMLKLYYDFHNGNICDCDEVKKLFNFYKKHLTNVKQLQRIKYNDPALMKALAQSGCTGQNLEELCQLTLFKLIIDDSRFT